MTIPVLDLPFQGVFQRSDRRYTFKYNLRDAKKCPMLAEYNHSCAYSPPDWLLARASEDWRQTSVKPAVAATPAAVVLMQ